MTIPRLAKTRTPRRLAIDPEGARSAPPLPEGASPGRRWRFRRNLVIYVAHRQGLSQRLLADVFDLPRSRIGEIVAEFRDFEQGGARTTDEELETSRAPGPEAR